jgi:lipoprotein-releasing system permease protein
VNLPFYLASHQLRTTRKGSFTRVAAILATVGLSIGIAALLITLFILKGFEQTLSAKIADFDGHVRIHHFLNKPMKEDLPRLDSLLAQGSGKILHSRYIQAPGLLRKGGQAEGIMVEGTDSAGLAYLNKILIAGSTRLNPNEIILGNRLAQQLNLQMGDQLVLFDLKSMTRPRPRLKALKIAGLFHSGLIEYDQSLTYIQLKTAQKLFAYRNQVSGHILRLESVERVPNLEQQLSDILPYPYMVTTWIEKNRNLFKWMNIQRWPILIIFGLIAIVGIVNIVSALTMIVVEKVRQIGVLLSMGIRRGDLRKIFLYEGFFVGCGGSLLGVALAVLLSWIQVRYQILAIPEEVYFMDHVPIQIDFSSILGVTGFGIVGALLASLWPTIRASRIQPAQSLRYE